MEIRSKILGELIKLSNNLGKGEYHLAIIGESNASAKVKVESIMESFYKSKQDPACNTLSKEVIIHLAERPDEKYQQELFKLQK